MYGKIFASLYQGTLRGNADGILVFTNLIAHMDASGWVDKHPRAIADEVGISIDRVRAALTELESPDAESRTEDEGGRRIVRIDDHRDWGWRVVNGPKYRAIRLEEDRRRQNREAQARWRDKQRKPESAAVSQDKPQSAEISPDKPMQKQKQKQSQEDEYCALALSPAAQARQPPHPAEGLFSQCEQPRPEAISAHSGPPTPPPAFDGENAAVIPARCVVSIALAFALPQEWGDDAERLGFDGKRVLLEGERFRQYWTSGNGSGKRRTLRGWRQAWSTWLGKAAKDGV